MKLCFFQIRHFAPHGGKTPFSSTFGKGGAKVLFSFSKRDGIQYTKLRQQKSAASIGLNTYS